MSYKPIVARAILADVRQNCPELAGESDAVVLRAYSLYEESEDYGNLSLLKHWVGVVFE